MIKGEKKRSIASVEIEAKRVRIPIIISGISYFSPEGSRNTPPKISKDFLFIFIIQKTFCSKIVAKIVKKGKEKISSLVERAFLC